MIQGLDVVFIHVRDPGLMARWYKDKLGLNIRVTTPDKSWQEFDIHSPQTTRFALDYTDESPSEVEKQRIMISFRVEDIESCVRKLNNRGVVFFGSPVIQKAGQSLFATFKDPEGNWLQLSQRE